MIGGRPAAWLRELLLGARLAAAGGRASWSRTAMTALGVGLGVALLLLAASTPTALDGREQRGAARDDLQTTAPPPKSDRTLLIADVGTEHRGDEVRGRLVRAEGARAPVPPGLERIPAPGDVVVSPRLERLLASPGGAALRPRIPGRVVGTIADAGLSGPGELAFYAGHAGLRSGADAVRRIDHFGGTSSSDGLAPIVALLVVVALVVLLVPVAVFLAAAVRFGGEERDRRLAALSLVGADRRMVRRIAAGEALLGALLGLVAGALLFLLARGLVERVDVDGLSVFATDLRPSVVLAVLVVVAVPVLSVVVTQLALSRVAIDPLGVVRRGSDRRRRVWWRLLLPVLGLLLLAPLLRVDLDAGEGFDPWLVSAGVTALLVGVTALLPWVVEAVVRRLRGGSVPWLLAVRRLQADSGTSARVVSGIAVAVAGAIALQTLFVAVEDRSTVGTDAGPAAGQVFVQASVGSDAPSPAELRGALRDAGVRGPAVQSTATLEGPGDTLPTVAVAPCSTLRRIAVLRRCADGDGFVLRRAEGEPAPRPGALLRDGRTRWRMPSGLRTVDARPDAPVFGATGQVLLTPGAPAARGLPVLTPSAVVRIGPGDAALERVQNAVAALDPLIRVDLLSGTVQAREFVAVRRGIVAGAIAVLVLIGASMVVSALEQLHARRRLLASLVAVGTPPATIRRSLLLQTTVPVALGLALAVVTGLGLGALLLRLVGEPVRFDVAPTLLIVGVGAAVVPLVSALSAPALRRVLRPGGLRTE